MLSGYHSRSTQRLHEPTDTPDEPSRQCPFLRWPANDSNLGPADAYQALAREENITQLHAQAPNLVAECCALHLDLEAAGPLAAVQHA